MWSVLRITVVISVLTVFLILSGFDAAPTAREECGPVLRVHLTVSPLVNESVRQLEVHWNGATPQPGDWVGLFASDPAGVVPLPPSLAAVDPAGSCAGWMRTAVTEEGRGNSSFELGFQPRCLDYYVGYVTSNGSVSASTCLRLEPTWMSERPALGALPLSNIFIPGTHDSGAWGEFDPELGENQVTKYTVTQDENILSQLIRGVRYLDIRVGYYPNANGSGFWLNHGLFQMHPMEEVTAQVRQFLDNTPTTELVIFDIQEFTIGFNSMEIHDLLVSFFAGEFRDYILPKDQTSSGWSTPLNELWATGGRLLVTYDDSSVAAAYPWLWQSVQHMWGNVRVVEDLYTYLQGVQANPPSGGRAWSAMAELTPTALDVITDVLGGLRVMADSVNRNVTTWYLGSWGNTVNTVAVDFFRNSDVVRAALEWNDKRAARRQNRFIG